MLRVPRTIGRRSGKLIAVDRGDGYHFKVRDVNSFLARNPRGRVVGSVGSQGANEPAAGSAEAALMAMTVPQLRELAEERGIQLESGRKADIVKTLVENDVEPPPEEDEEEDEED